MQAGLSDKPSVKTSVIPLPMFAKRAKCEVEEGIIYDIIIYWFAFVAGDFFFSIPKEGPILQSGLN